MNGDRSESSGRHLLPWARFQYSIVVVIETKTGTTAPAHFQIAVKEFKAAGSRRPDSCKEMYHLMIN